MIHQLPFRYSLNFPTKQPRLPTFATPPHSHSYHTNAPFLSIKVNRVYLCQAFYLNRILLIRKFSNDHLISFRSKSRMVFYPLDFLSDNDFVNSQQCLLPQPQKHGGRPDSINGHLAISKSVPFSLRKYSFVSYFEIPLDIW